MKYTKFTIKNFKGIPNITLDLEREPSVNVTTLVGLNESGKTSILEAINLFQNGVEEEDAHLLVPKSQQHSFNGSIEIEATLELSEHEIKDIQNFLQKDYKFYLSDAEEDKVIKIRKKYNYKNSIPHKESFLETLWTTKFLGKTKQASSEKKLIDWKKDAWNKVIEKIKNDFVPQILYYEDFLFVFPEKIYLEKFPSEGEEQEEYRAVVQDILNVVGYDLSIEEHLLERMKNSDDKGHKNALDSLLEKMAGQINTDILKKWDEIFGSKQNKSVIISYDSESINQPSGVTHHRYYLEIKIKQGDDKYSINDRSLGFRWFFSFLIFTAFRKSRSDDPGETLFLLDEPASNLHQKSQQTLLQSIEGIFSNCKLIYSTHSHHLINPDWLSGAYIIKNKAINYGSLEESDTTETDISATLYKNFVANYPTEEDHFKPIMDSLEYSPSKLELVPEIIFTEGKNDYYTFKYLSKTIFDDKNHFNFYPGAGKDKYERIIKIYLAWGRNFITLFDADKGGKDANKRYLTSIGPELEDRLFTLGDVQKAWDGQEVEDLFTETEKLKIIQYSFPDHKKESGYNKSKFNTAIQDLYINNIKFPLNKGTIKKFDEIFKFIQEKINH